MVAVEEARQTGFCLGVRRALRLLEAAVKDGGAVESLGAVVHNRQVSDKLARIGVRSIGTLDEMSGRVVGIPSHGVGRALMEEIRARGLDVVDTTCPRVRKAQRAAQKLAAAGFGVVIFGDGAHPEVRGVLDWAGDKGLVTMDGANIPWEDGKPPRRLGVLCQTTQNPEYFNHFLSDVARCYLPHLEELRVVNTICNTTRERQEAALELARRVKLMLVVGGYDSSNTRRLAEVCASAGVETHHIETAGDLREEWLAAGHIGVTAGASTPDEIVQEVISNLRAKGATGAGR